MDSGFCVLGALIQLKKYGVFALIMVKKKSWPRGSDGESIEENTTQRPLELPTHKRANTIQQLPAKRNRTNCIDHWDVWI